MQEGMNDLIMGMHMVNIDRLKTEHQIRRWIQECRRGHPGLSRIFLFLDFDGVINTYQNANYRQIFTGTLTKDDITDLTTPACMQNLNAFVLEFQPDIIISSSWRYSGLDYCRDYLYHGGLDASARITDTTTRDGFLPREEEILQYLQQNHEMTGMLILDDIYMEPLAKYQVTTDFSRGFDRDALARARKICGAKG